MVRFSSQAGYEAKWQRFQMAIHGCQPENSIRDEALGLIKQGVESEESAGYFCLLFAETVSELIPSDGDVSDARKETLGLLCTLAEKRIFPTMLWARLVKENLHQPKFVKKELRRWISVKKKLLPRIKQVVRENKQAFCLENDSKIFVNGYSATVVSSLIELEKEYGGKLSILVPYAQGKQGQSEGKLLQKDLREKGFDKVEVLGDLDDENAAYLFNTQKIDLFMTGAKAVSIGDDGLPELVSSPRKGEYARYCKEGQNKNLKIIVVTGIYKFWPKDLYREVGRKIKDAQELTRIPTEWFLGGPVIDHWLTEDGIFTSQSLLSKYEDEFQPMSIRFPSWSKAAEDAVKALLTAAGIEPGDIPPQEFTEMVDVYKSKKYVENHWDKFLAKYNGNYVAFIGGKYSAHAKTIEEIEELISKLNPPKKHVYVTKMVPRENPSRMPPGNSHK